jgi:hypothetical protein
MEPRARRRFWRRRRAASEPEPQPAGEDTEDLAPPAEPESKPEPEPVSVDDRAGT